MANLLTMKLDYTPSAVTFHIFRKDGSRNPDIKYSFIEKRNIDAFDAQGGSITLDDKTVWALVLEPDVSKALATESSVYCLVSFQARVNGNFAVARRFKADYTQKGRHSTASNPTDTNRSNGS